MLITADGVVPNRKFFACMQQHLMKLYTKHQIHIVMITEMCMLYSDVPHLIETVRNCRSNSFAHSDSQAL